MPPNPPNQIELIGGFFAQVYNDKNFQETMKNIGLGENFAELGRFDQAHLYFSMAKLHISNLAIHFQFLSPEKTTDMLLNDTSQKINLCKKMLKKTEEESKNKHNPFRQYRYKPY